MRLFKSLTGPLGDKRVSLSLHPASATGPSAGQRTLRLLVDIPETPLADMAKVLGRVVTAVRPERDD